MACTGGYPNTPSKHNNLFSISITGTMTITTYQSTTTITTHKSTISITNTSPHHRTPLSGAPCPSLPTWTSSEPSMSSSSGAGSQRWGTGLFGLDLHPTSPSGRGAGPGSHGLGGARRLDSYEFIFIFIFWLYPIDVSNKPERE